MFRCFRARSDIQTQRRMSCGLWPSLACAQQVVTNDLIVNLSWGAACQWGTRGLFVTTGSWNFVSRVGTLKDAHAWMLACTHRYKYTYLEAHLDVVSDVEKKIRMNAHKERSVTCKLSKGLLPTLKTINWFIGLFSLGQRVIVKSFTNTCYSGKWSAFLTVFPC